MLTPTVRAARLPAAALRKPAKNRRNDRLRVPAPELPDYPPGWLTLTAHEVGRTLACDEPEAKWSADGGHLWVPYSAGAVAELLALCRLPCPECWPTCFTAGCWLDLGGMSA